MAKRRKPVKLTRKDKRFIAFADKLRQLRQYVSGFDSDRWEKLYLYAPPADMAPDLREQAQRERFRNIMQVTSKFALLKPYLTANKKRVVPKSPDKVQVLRQYAQMPNIKGLRAVPVEAADPSKLHVRFSKVTVKEPPTRKGKKPRVRTVTKLTVKEGAFKQEFFPFPRTVKSIIQSEGYENLADEIVSMLEDMTPRLPKGIYIFRHKHFMMLEPKAYRDVFARRARIFFSTDSGEKHFVVSNLVGLIRLADQDPKYLALVEQMREGRTRAQQTRARDKLRSKERTIRKYIKRRRGK